MSDKAVAKVQGGGVMSYTMTLDMPKKTAEYVKYRGPNFRAELNSLFIAFVTTEMRRDGFEWSETQDEEKEDMSEENLVDMLSGVVKLPENFDDRNIRADAALEKYERIS